MLAAAPLTSLTEGLRPSDSPTGSLAGAQGPAPLTRLTRVRSFAPFMR